MVDLDQFTEADAAPDQRPDPSRWSDAEYLRAVALLAYSAQIEDDEAAYRAPNYDL